MESASHCWPRRHFHTMTQIAVAIKVAYSSILNATRVMSGCLDVLQVCITQWSLVDFVFKA